MNQQSTKGNLELSGSSSISGGVYDKISIAGSAAVRGDLEAHRVETAGSLKVEGRLMADDLIASGSWRCSGDAEIGCLEASGSFRADGSLHVGKMTTSGSIEVGKDLVADHVETSGSTKIGGGIKGGKVSLSGSLDVGGDIEVEQFSSSGLLKVEGLINADVVEIEPHAGCRAREIGGGRISVCLGSIKLGPGVVGDLVSRVLGGISKRALTVDTIEGDDIELEATHAKVVRGKRVAIGVGCTIGTVEYSESLLVDDAATVENRVQSSG